LNVGPMPNGKIQSEFTDTLAAVGKWMSKYGNSIYGTRGNLMAPQKWGVVTKKDKTVYLHILNKPEQSQILIPEMNQKVTAVRLMNGGSNVEYKQQSDGLLLDIKNVKFDPYDTIIQISLQ
jgi:alpha-L-fucosidase